MQQTIVFLTLILALILFSWGKIRHDFVSLIALFILVITGIIEPAAAFSGFGHPAVITVASVLIIGKALEFSGLIDVIGKQVIKIGKNLVLQIFVLSFLVAFASAFMNNVGALAIFMPIAIHLARKNGTPPSYVLMPIAFASLLGGMTTLIGTPPNIIIASFREAEKGASFGMFDFAPVGIVITLAGLVFISLLGWKLLPRRQPEKSDKELFEIDDYITEVRISENSRIKNKNIHDVFKNISADIQVLGLIRDHVRIHAPSGSEILQVNDIMILEADAENLKSFTEDTGTELVGNEELQKESSSSGNIFVTEAVVMSDSHIVGKTSKSLRLRDTYRVNLLAVARRDTKIKRRLGEVIFQSGDVLLLQGREASIFNIIGELGCLPLARRGLRIGSKTKILLALSIFIASVIVVVSDLLPVEIAFSMAALAMVLTNVIPVKHVYNSVDWPVIILLGAMIPVGVALETSGGTQMIASAILSAAESFQPWFILSLLLITTMLLSSIINNAATVILMAPIAISISRGMSLAADPFLMTVAIGASAAFLTPIGHQSNTLVMGPGGYKFNDYLRMGFPMVIIVLLVGIPAILFFWPV
jgi:di/tricarboxylate transporter